MNKQYVYSDHINLFVEHHITEEDAKRQEATAKEILNRLEQQPGLILADEVGMGKTFVALAVATSMALSSRMPVVIMVPPSLKEKWPRDFELFREKCLIKREVSESLQYGKAERAVEFLKLLDDPSKKRKSIIFLTHGAMYRALNDGWVKLALIQRALYRRKDVDHLRQALARIIGQLLHMRWVDKYGDEVWLELLKNHPARWLDILHRYEVDPENNSDCKDDDDPVPQDILDALEIIDTDNLFQALKNIPYRRTRNFRSNLEDARSEISDEMKDLWHECLRGIDFRLPLLILDEAHHLKNPDTQFASLFQVKDAEDDATQLSGQLSGIFERMLFLTATPFQLGHHELCSVLERFKGIAWDAQNSLMITREEFIKEIQELRGQLDSAQKAALRLDRAWGQLTQAELIADDHTFEDVSAWWAHVQNPDNQKNLTPNAANVIERYRQTKEQMKKAEESLRPWVIRHLKSKNLPHPYEGLRRQSLVGRAIIDDTTDNQSQTGLSISGQALLPFLLAARATVYMPDARPIFAEGLASSYEAFLHTRSSQDRSLLTDSDDDALESSCLEANGDWYIQKLESVIKNYKDKRSLLHPKIEATVERVIELWEKGEKVLVFCHYIATGRALRQVISEAIYKKILERGKEKIGCNRETLEKEFDRIGNSFFDEDSLIRRTCDHEIRVILKDYNFPEDFKTDIIEVIRRYLRTPSFLVRYLPLGDQKLSEDAIRKTFADTVDSSGLSLRRVLETFLHFLNRRCSIEDRKRYLEAVKSIQTGSLSGTDVEKTFEDDELQGDERSRLVPNVRLVNGQTKPETRQRIILTFNTPFFPEILIASNVLAEGVDLHLNCRYIIHYDLCWNPSTLEQRTGRIDRIGAKVEACGKPILIYMPFISETQDEKMYRVVIDRERWFKVVMGEKYKIDVRTTEKLGERLPLPESVADELAFKLGVYEGLSDVTYSNLL